MSEISAIVLVVFYLPLCIGVLFLINLFLKKSSVNLRGQRTLMACLSIMMFLIVTWDAIIGGYYLNQLCQNKGGAYINSDVLVEGIYLNSRGEARHTKLFLEKGYKFVEMNRNRSRENGYIRYQLGPDGNIEELLVSKLDSKYTRGFDNPNTKVGPDFLNITLSEQYVENIVTKKRIAGFRAYRTHTWLDRKLRGYVYPKTCTSISKFKDLEKYNDSSHYHELITDSKKD